MPIPRAEALRQSELWKLALDETPPRGAAGERMALGVGASLEFQDRRAYAPGDDVRHVDWRALARTDQLMVRQWRAEVLPRVEILVDASRSMAIDAAKEQLVCDLTALLAHAALESGALPVIVRVAARPRVVPLDELEHGGLEFDAREPFDDALRAAGGLLRHGAIRILLSDFLFPHDAADLVRPLGSSAGALALVQVLARSEDAPEHGGAYRLTDCETDEVQDLVLDANTVTRYRERLRRLCDALEIEARRARGRFVPLVADRDLAWLCRERLAREGVLAPR